MCVCVCVFSCWCPLFSLRRKGAGGGGVPVGVPFFKLRKQGAGEREVPVGVRLRLRRKKLGGEPTQTTRLTDPDGITLEHMGFLGCPLGNTTGRAFGGSRASGRPKHRPFWGSPGFGFLG